MNILKSLSWLTVTEAISRLGAVFVVIYLARVQGVELLGVLGAAFAVASIVQLIAVSALSSRGLRDLVQGGVDPGLVITVNVSTQLILLFACVILTMGATFLMGVRPEIQLVLAVYLLLPLFKALALTWVLRAKNDLAPAAISEALAWVIHVGVMVATVDPETPAYAVAACHVFGYAVAVPITLLPVRRYFPFVLVVPQLAEILSLLRSGLQISVGGLRRLVFAQSDVFILAVVVGAVAAGEFSASHRVVLTLLVPGDLLRSAVFPRVAQLMADRPKAAFRQQWRALRFEWLLVIPLCLCIALASEEIVGVLYGRGHDLAVDVLRCMIPAVLLMGLSQVFQSILLAQGRDAAQGVTTGIALCSHLVLSVFFSMAWGPLGAAIASLVSLVAGTMLLWTSVPDAGIGAGMLRQMLKLPCAAVLALAIVATLPTFGLALRLLFGLVLFVAFLWMLRAVSSVEFRWLQAVCRQLWFGRLSLGGATP